LSFALACLASHNLLAADSATKPNQAVQDMQTFIKQNKIVLMTGSDLEHELLDAAGDADSE